MISNESLTTFRRLYFSEYGVWLSDQETHELASNLLNLYQAVYLDNEISDGGDSEKKL